jgi:transcriptional regulator with XRE-family HTH domain
MTNGKPRRTKFPANLVGPQIRKLRSARGWSQAKFAVQLQLKGLDMGRDVVARIECRIHCIRDRDILLFARTLGVEVSKLFSSLEEKNSRG